MKIISNQLDIKLEQFMQKEFDLVLRKIKNQKAAGLDEIPLKYGRQGNLMTYCFDTVVPNITRTQLTDRHRAASSARVTLE